jgi:hypothetical protein
MPEIVQARPARKLKVRRSLGFSGETREATDERLRVEAINYYNATALHSSPLSASLRKAEDGRCYLYVIGPKLHKKGEPQKARKLRPADRVVFDALLRGTPGSESYTSEQGYFVARLPVAATLFASIPLYADDTPAKV